METKADIVSLLRVELHRRTSQKSGYSMRAFARDLGVSSSHLCGVLQGKKKLSVGSLLRICDRLHLDAPATADILVKSVDHWYRPSTPIPEPTE